MSTLTRIIRSGCHHRPACKAASALTSITVDGSALVSATLSDFPPHRPVPISSGHG
jgi:hypothetical protein